LDDAALTAVAGGVSTVRTAPDGQVVVDFHLPEHELTELWKTEQSTRAGATG
jgi:hypothetical protein